jgi:RNA polymerase sigma factor (sigma-70 family)
MNGAADTRTAEAVGFARSVDAMVLARAQRGDMQAFAAIYGLFGKACFNLSLRVLGDPASAEDLVQEVFLKMIDTIRSYRGDAPFGGWLKRMTVNACIDHLRRRRRDSDGDPEALFAEMPNAAAEPDVGIDAWDLLRRLPSRARAVLVLHEFEGYTHTELSQLFGQSESYSKSIVARAMKRLGEWVATKDIQP